MRAWIIGLVITPFVMATGAIGVQSNAAMYLSALVFCSLAGWPSSLWGAAHGYIVTVMFAPLLGAVLGGQLAGPNVSAEGDRQGAGMGMSGDNYYRLLGPFSGNLDLAIVSKHAG